MTKLWIALGLAAGLGLGSEAMAQGVELGGNARFQLQTGLMKVSATGGLRRTSTPAVFVELRDQSEVDFLQQENIRHPNPNAEPPDYYVPPPCPVNVPRIHTPALEIYLPVAWQAGIVTPPECIEKTLPYRATTCIPVLALSQSGNDFSLSLDEARVQEIMSQIALFLLGDSALGSTTTVDEIVADGKLLADGNRTRLKFRVKATVSGKGLKKDSKLAWSFTLVGDRVATEDCDITIP